MVNYYIAKINIRGCFADIRINDVPLFRQDVDGDYTLESPVNYLIEASGSQKLTACMLPTAEHQVRLQAGSFCTVEIWEYDGSGSMLRPVKALCDISLKVEDRDSLIPVQKHMKIFHAEVPYRLYRWGNCRKLDNNRALSSHVAEFFKSVMQILTDKQFDRYEELILERETNICKSLYLEAEDVELRNRLLFENLKSGFIPQPLKGGKILQFYADGRAVTVLDKDHKPALRFINENTGEILLIELLLGIKNRKNELSII